LLKKDVDVILVPYDHDWSTGYASIVKE
jgi:hypothetical protein